MTDEYDDFEKLAEKLRASPQLLKAWQNSSARQSSYAWYLLNHSWQISPEVERDYIAHNPRLRIWDDARGWTDHEPYTLTVFRGLDELTLCRRAVWHCKRPGEIQRKLVEFFENKGEVKFHEPDISVVDTDVPFPQLNRQLQAIAACTVPAISIQDPKTYSVTTAVGSIGFEYFSQTNHQHASDTNGLITLCRNGNHCSKRFRYSENFCSLASSDSSTSLGFHRLLTDA